MNKDVLERYTPGQQFEIAQFFKVLAERTRKSQKISDSRMENIIKDWEDYDTDVVLDSLRKFVETKTSASQNEKYVRGIMRNKQKEKEVKLNGRNRSNNRANKESPRGEKLTDEGARLREFTATRNISGTDLDCDF